MKILAFEFSSPQRSVAVVCAPEHAVLRQPERGHAVDAKRTEPVRPDDPAIAGLPVLGLSASPAASEVIDAGHGNTMNPLDMVEEALKQAGLEREQIGCLAIGIGPGSTRESGPPSRWGRAGSWRAV